MREQSKHFTETETETETGRQTESQKDRERKRGEKKRREDLEVWGLSACSYCVKLLRSFSKANTKQFLVTLIFLKFTPDYNLQVKNKVTIQNVMSQNMIFVVHFLFLNTIPNLTTFEI